MIFIRTFMASYKKQIREFRRYPNFLLKSFFYTPITIVLPYFFMIKVFNGENISQENIVTFTLLLGVVLWNYVYFSIIETCNIVSRELNLGTVEIIYTTTSSKIAWLLGSSFAPSSMFFISLSSIVLILYFIIKPIIIVNYTLIIITIILTIISTWSMCIIAFILNLWLKKVFNLLNFSLDIIAVFVGQLYLINNLPKLMRVISKLIPTTYSISLIRHGFTSNIFSYSVITQIILLTIITSFLAIISIVIYNLIESRLRKDGNFLKF